MTRRRRDDRPSMWPRLLLFVSVCILAGAFVAWLDQRRDPTHTGQPMNGKPPIHQIALQPSAQAADHERLQREIARLKEVIKQKDRQIDDLTIQLKILTDGSRTDGK